MFLLRNNVWRLFYLILKTLHLPENSFEYIEDERKNENSGDEMDIEETDEFINDPRHKIEFFLEELIINSKKYFTLRQKYYNW